MGDGVGAMMVGDTKEASRPKQTWGCLQMGNLSEPRERGKSRHLGDEGCGGKCGGLLVLAQGWT